MNRMLFITLMLPSFLMILPEYRNMGVSAAVLMAKTRPCKNFIACAPLQSDRCPRSSKSMNSWVSEPSRIPTDVAYIRKMITLRSHNTLKISCFGFCDTIWDDDVKVGIFLMTKKSMTKRIDMTVKAGL
eukprot:02564.XXX_409_795_1 [CDS] Oithona nana genome sequencing.